MRIDANNYIFTKEIYHEEFKNILSKMVSVYKMMIYDGVILERKENKIRDVLVLDYLKNNKKRTELGILHYGFEREVMEDDSAGRMDIKITSLNSWSDTSEYYNCECKLLDNKYPDASSGLNAKYIANGICRFTSGYYHTSATNANGMIGFVIDKMDIDANICKINKLLVMPLKNSDGKVVSPNTFSPIAKTDFIQDFEYQYTSEHTLNQDRNITLYHLMMDFSNNIGIIDHNDLN